VLVDNIGVSVILVGLVIIVGLVLILAGLVIAWQESSTLSAGGFVEALTSLVQALRDSRPSLVLFAFGTLLVFLGLGALVVVS